MPTTSTTKESQELVGNARAVMELVSEVENSPGMDAFFQTGRSAAQIQADFAALGERAVPPLVELLRHPRERVRQIAAQQLGRLKAKAAVQPMLALLNAQPEPGSQQLDRAACVVALGEIGDASAVESLKKLATDPKARVRAAAIGSLAQVGDESTVPFILQGLHDPDFRVRLRAAESLGKFPSENAAKGLCKALADDEGVALAAAISLAEMGRADGIVQLIRGLKQTGAPDDELRIQIALLLGKTGDARAKDALQWAATSEYSSPQLKEQATKSLQMLGDK